MPHDSDESTMPKCLFCSQRREGQRYTFWGGDHVSTKTKRAFLSSRTTITSEYRGIKRVGAFVCRDCARRTIARSSLLTIIVSSLSAVVCVGLAVASSDSALFRVGAIVGAVLAGLIAGGYFLMSLFPNIDSATSDAIIRDRAAPLLRRKGKGTSFFTEREYEVLFTRKPADRPETAEELLEGIDDDDFDTPRSARG